MLKYFTYQHLMTNVLLWTSELPTESQNNNHTNEGTLMFILKYFMNCELDKVENGAIITGCQSI